MTEYSVEGYVTALRFRSHPTLLVEGSSDKTFFSRILHELTSEAVGAAIPVVDTAELLRGDDRAIGNRALVEEAHRLASSDGIKLYAVVDREYREFNLACVPADSLGAHRVIDSTLFWTRGHSIENYFLHGSACVHVVKHQFADVLAPGVAYAIHEALPSILLDVCAVTLALRAESLLERALGLCKREMWQPSGENRVRLDFDLLSQALGSRGVAAPVQRAVKEAALEAREQLGLSKDPELSRWLAHGRLGWDMTWCALSALTAPAHSSEAIAEQIGSGYREAKFKCACDALARAAEALPIPDLWKRLGFEVCGESAA